MTATPETGPPHQPEQRERPLPEGAITGEDLLTLAREAAVEYCTGCHLDASLPDRFMEHVEAWGATMRPGEPVLVLRRGFGDDMQFHSGGWAASQLYGVVSTWGRQLSLRVAITKRDYNNSQHEAFFERRLEETVMEHSAPDTPPLWVVGEQPVREWMERFGRRLTADDPERTLAHAQFLGDVRRSAFPFDYLNLSDERRMQLANRFLQFVLETDQRFRQEEVFKALEYLLGIATSEERAVLVEAIEDQWVDMLPVTTEPDDTDMVSVVQGALRLRPIPEDLTRNHNQVPRHNVRHAHYLADLYSRRARREAGGTMPIDPELRVSSMEYAEWPMQGELRILTQDFPSSRIVAHEVAQLRLLHAVDVPVTEVYARDMESMRRAARALCDRAFNANDRVERLETFTALEHLFNLEREPQRDEFYRLLIERFAQTVPLQGSPHRHIGIAEAIGQLMPNPPTADGTPLLGTARTAAIMARMYARRAQQNLRQQLGRYTPLDENEEEPTTGEGGIEVEFPVRP